MKKETLPATTSSYVTMLEIIEMKVMRMSGMTLTKIAEKVKRSHSTVKHSLQLFDDILPTEVDLKNKVIDRFQEIMERHLQNAEVIIQASDNQVMRKIYDEGTTAMEAAKIRQIYGQEERSILGIKFGVIPESETKNPVVINFINKVINIKQDVRFRPKPADQGGPEEYDGGEQAPVVEGALPG